MNFQWTFLIDLGVIGLALLAATLIRSRVPFFQKFLIPNSLTAGFILFPFYNWLAPRLGLGMGNLENLVFHCLNLSFIAMSLRGGEKREKKGIRDIFATANSVLAQYAIQCFIGVGLTLVLMFTILPNLFPGYGLFATLGFSLGPGQAFSMGNSWEKILTDAAAGGAVIPYHYQGLGGVGLTFGAVGFLWACFGGIFLINWGIRKGWIDRAEIDHLNQRNIRRGLSPRGETAALSGERDLTNPEAIDPLSFNLALVLGTYLITYMFMIGQTKLLSMLGPRPALLAQNFWSIMFIFCAVFAMIVRSVLKLFKIEYIVDDNRMNRISGFSVDFMVAAALGAISIAVIKEYWVSILIITTATGLVSTVTHIWLSSRMFTDHVFYRTMLVYGCITGTLPTGLALLRVLDPHFATPASRDYMMASGIVFLLAIPILMTANMPLWDAIDGHVTRTWWLMGLYLLYIILCLAAYFVLSGRRGLKKPGHIWLRRVKGE
jgi:ESS family glutamate:Na+ symporter